MKGRIPPRVASLALLLLRLATAGVFLYAASTKLPNMELFAEETANYQMLPAWLVPYFSTMLIGVEVLAGLMLLFGLFVRAAAAVTVLMNIAFIVALSQALIRGIDLTCGCFGGADLATWGTVLRDVLYIAMALPVVYFGGGSLRALLPRRQSARAGAEPL